MIGVTLEHYRIVEKIGQGSTYEGDVPGRGPAHAILNYEILKTLERRGGPFEAYQLNDFRLRRGNQLSGFKWVHCQLLRGYC